MIPSSFLPGAEGALPVTTDSPSPDDFSAPAAFEGETFSSYIAQALNSTLPSIPDPYQNPALPPPDYDSSPASPAEDYYSNSSRWSATNANKAASPAESQDNHSQKTADRKKDSDTVDPTVANNLSALMPGQVALAAKPQDPVAMLSTGKTGDSSDSCGSVTASGGKADDSSVAGQGSSAQAAGQTASPVAKALATGAPHLATALNPSDATAAAAKDSAQPTSESQIPSAKAADAVKATTQATISQTVTTIDAEGGTAITDTGTSAALDTQIMKSTGQKNETAGRTVQKLPRTSSNVSLSPDSGSASATQLATTGSGRKTEWTSLPGMIDLTVQGATSELHDSSALVAGSAADSSASQVERVAHLVTQEALVIRQSGAASLAVSLKLDHQTELFVHLTNHNGQIQASLRCERGNLSGLDGHWGQLQESLARQNVQLLPQEDRSSFRNQPGAYSDATGSRDSAGQPSQNQRQPSGSLNAEPSVTTQPADPAASAKTKNKNAGRKGWESWA